MKKITLLLITLFLIPSVHAALTDKLMAGYNHDTDATDVLGVTNGSAIAVKNITGKIGGAYFIGTTGQRNQLPATTLFDFGIENHAISMWVNVTTTGAYHSMWNRFAAGVAFHNCRLTDANVFEIEAYQPGGTRCQMRTGDLSGTDLFNGQWHHIVCMRVYSGACDGTFRLYIDGVNQTLTVTAESGSNVSITSAYGPARLGSDTVTDGAGLNGGMDLVYIWNRSLSAAEITSLYNSGSGLSYPFASNSAPVLDVVQITPATAYTNSALNASFNFSDADADTWSAEVEWFTNNASNTSFGGSWGSVSKNLLYNNATAGVTINNVTKGQAWILEVTIWDGTVNASKNSSALLISNTAPVISSSNITPRVVYANDTLIGWCNASDIDLDNITYYYAWYRNNLSNLSGGSKEYCFQQSANESKGCGVTNTTRAYRFVDDWGNNESNLVDEDYSTYADWAQLTASGTATMYVNYTIPAFAINASWEIRVRELVGVFNRTNMSIPSTCFSNSNVLQLMAQSYKSGTLFQSIWSCYNGTWNTIEIHGNNNNMYSNDIFEEGVWWAFPNNYTSNKVVEVNSLYGRNKSDTWIFSCKAGDSIGNSSWLNSSAVLIGNSPPINPLLVNLVLNTTNPFNYTSANVTFYNLTKAIDVDGDAVILKLKWFRNGIENITWENLTKVYDTNTSRGDGFIVEVLPYDGIVYGSPTNTSNLSIYLPQNNWVCSSFDQCEYLTISEALYKENNTDTTIHLMNSSKYTINTTASFSLPISTYLIGINFSVNNIILDCNNSYIIGDTANYGLEAKDVNNTAITNCNIQGFTVGIEFINSTRSSINNSLLLNQAIYGIEIVNSNFGTLTNSIIDSTEGNNGLISDSNHSIIKNNIFRNIFKDNAISVTLAYSPYNVTFEGNTFYNNSINLGIANTNHSLIKDNYFGNHSDSSYFGFDFNSVIVSCEGCDTVFANNTFGNIHGYSLWLTDFGGTYGFVDGINITGNSFYNNTGSSIKIDTGSANNTIYLNNFYTGNVTDSDGRNFYCANTTSGEEGNFYAKGITPFVGDCGLINITIPQPSDVYQDQMRVSWHNQSSNKVITYIIEYKLSDWLPLTQTTNNYYDWDFHTLTDNNYQLRITPFDGEYNGTVNISTFTVHNHPQIESAGGAAGATVLSDDSGISAEEKEEPVKESTDKIDKLINALFEIPRKVSPGHPVIGMAVIFALIMSASFLAGRISDSIILAKKKKKIRKEEEEWQEE